jgi:hypothetical protein
VKGTEILGGWAVLFWYTKVRCRWLAKSFVFLMLRYDSCTQVFLVDNGICWFGWRD